MKKLSKLTIVLLLMNIAFFQACTTETVERESEKQIDKQLNITFLLDLSDRIEPSKYPCTPEHYERDMAIVSEFLSLFKADMEQKGGFMAKGKMRVVFNPIPKNRDINNIASELNVDLSKCKNPKEKKVIFDKVSTIFSTNLEKIYNKTLETKKYIGSDIWVFFKDDVKDLAIDNDSNYRNILVVVTDGYIYHKNSKRKDKNRYSWVLPTTLNQLGLTKSDWAKKMDKLDYGLIAPHNDLDDLEVLVLEVNPVQKAYSYEEDVLRAVLSKWFTEMGIKKFEIYKTDLPQNIKMRIKKFMNE